MTTGEKIKYLRTQLHLTQDQLGSMTGIHPVTIRKYELGKIHPTPSQIEKIASALGVGSIALSGVDKTGLRIETTGDIKGLLMALYNVGIISFSGTRNADKQLISETVKISFNPVLSPYICLSVSANSSDIMEISSTNLIINSQPILDELLAWEKHKYLYGIFLDECDPDDILTQEQLKTYQDTIDKIELEMQRTQVRLKNT